MLGYCGIDCAECAAYKGTVSADVGLLKEVADSYGDGTFRAPDWVCLGCTPADQTLLAKDCATCKIRRCAIEKEVQNCSACDDYEPRAPLHDFNKGENEALRRRMEWLRGRSVSLKGEPGRAEA